MRWLKRLLGGKSSDPEGEPEIYYAPETDMAEPSASARETFRYFWREMAWEQRRIVPACEIASVKAPFDDGGDHVEHMWIANVSFDGITLLGELLNAPDRLRSVKQGDLVELPLEDLSDWMYVIDGRVYGAFTVNAMRAAMDPRSRAEHDAAWGLDFGDPRTIEVVPNGPGWESADGEHPMSRNMAPKLAEHLAENPDFATDLDDDGWAQLHHLALAGSYDGVKLLLDHGADPNAETPHEMTPLALAERLGWARVAELLRARGATR